MLYVSFRCDRASGDISEIVVVGNASMYEICARVSDSVGFKYKETREACYMPLACMIRIVL